jgi:tellurite resistance protein TerC
MTVPFWAWAAFCAFIVAMLALDLFVLHRRAHEVSLREAATWTAVWVAMGLAFAGVLWAWRGGGSAQSYLAGYLIEKSLSLDNVFVFAVIFSAFAIPPRYQHRVLMYGIAGALVMRAAFILAGAALLEHFHVVSYLFGAVLLVAAVKMLRGGIDHQMQPQRSRVLRALSRILPATQQPHGQRFLVRERGRLLATPLLLALIVVETTDVIFAVDSIPAILAVTTDTFVVYTSNVFALLGMRALYFLLAGAAAQVRFLQPGLAVILAGIAAKMLTADLYEVPGWVSPAFIAVVLAVVAALSVRDSRRRARTPDPPQEELRSRSDAVRLLSRTDPSRLPPGTHLRDAFVIVTAMEELATDLMLLAARDDGRLNVPQQLRFGLSGSELVRLAAARRVDVVRGRVAVLDTAPTGDPLLDEALASMAAGRRGEPTAKAWVARQRPRLVQRYLARLEEAGTIRADRRTVLGFIPVTRWTIVDTARAAQARARLQAVASSPGSADSEQAALAGLASAIGVTRYVPGIDGAARKRLKEAARRDRPAGTVTSAVAGATSGSDAATAAATDAATRAATDAAVRAATDAAIAAAIDAATAAAVSAAHDAGHHGGAAGGHH